MITKSSHNYEKFYVMEQKYLKVTSNKGQILLCRY